MAELESILKDLVYASVGAVSAVIDKGSDLAQELIERGRKTVEENRGNIDQLKQKAKEAVESISKIDVHVLSEEQRADLRRQLDELEEELKAAAEAAKESADTVVDELKQTIDELKKEEAAEANEATPTDEEAEAAVDAVVEEKAPEVPVLHVDEDDNE